MSDITRVQRVSTAFFLVCLLYGGSVAVAKHNFETGGAKAYLAGHKADNRKVVLWKDEDFLTTMERGALREIGAQEAGRL